MESVVDCWLLVGCGTDEPNFSLGLLPESLLVMQGTPCAVKNSFLCTAWPGDSQGPLRIPEIGYPTAPFFISCGLLTWQTCQSQRIEPQHDTIVSFCVLFVYKSRWAALQADCSVLHNTKHALLNHRGVLDRCRWWRLSFSFTPPTRTATHFQQLCVGAVSGARCLPAAVGGQRSCPFSTAEPRLSAPQRHGSKGAQSAAHTHPRLFSLPGVAASASSAACWPGWGRFRVEFNCCFILFFPLCTFKQTQITTIYTIIL